MSKKILTLCGIALLFIGGLFFLKYSSFGSEFVWNASRGGEWLFPLVTVSALLDSVNPCAFSVLLITIAFLFGLGRARREVLRLGSSYIAGLFAVYLLIGLGLLKALHIFGVPHFMGKVGAFVIIIFGILNLLSQYIPQLKLPGIPTGAHKKMAQLLEQLSVPALFLVGALVALCEFPCTGGPYLMILGLLHDSGTYASGFAYLIYYNLLFILPLVVILFIASREGILAKVQQWKKDETHAMKRWVGLGMIVLGFITLALV